MSADATNPRVTTTGTMLPSPALKRMLKTSSGQRSRVAKATPKQKKIREFNHHKFTPVTNNGRQETVKTSPKSEPEGVPSLNLSKKNWRSASHRNSWNRRPITLLGWRPRMGSEAGEREQNSALRDSCAVKLWACISSKQFTRPGSLCRRKIKKNKKVFLVRFSPRGEEKVGLAYKGCG